MLQLMSKSTRLKLAVDLKISIIFVIAIEYSIVATDVIGQKSYPSKYQL
ncbi:hypothetical protein NIES25_52560 [Nostoc linckia NIES-25]|nr:hypothetical protein NIES25_52560 [Nostoc linckia NIES-25]